MGDEARQMTAHGAHQGWCAGRLCSSRGSPAAFPGALRVKHMTRRAFSAKHCSESNSVAAGFFGSLALASFLASFGGEAFRGCSGGPGAEFDQRIVFRPCWLARASLCAAVGANGARRRALATASRQQNVPAVQTRLRMTALMALARAGAQAPLQAAVAHQRPSQAPPGSST